MCLGCIVRSSNKRERHFREKRDKKGKSVPLPSDGPFTMLSQGIFATSFSINRKKPQNRSGVCGAALVQCYKREDKSTIEEIMAKGEIGGFMH